MNDIILKDFELGSYVYQPISVNVKSGFFSLHPFFSLLVFKIIFLFASQSLVFSVLHTDVWSIFPPSPHICIRIMAEFRKIQHNAALMVAPFLIHTGYKILATQEMNLKLHLARGPRQVYSYW